MIEKLKLFFGSLEDWNYLNKQHNRIKFGANLTWKVFYAGFTLKRFITIVKCVALSVFAATLSFTFIVLWSCVRDVSGY